MQRAGRDRNLVFLKAPGHECRNGFNPESAFNL